MSTLDPTSRQGRNYYMQRLADKHAISNWVRSTRSASTAATWTSNTASATALAHFWTLFSSFLPEGQEGLEEIGAFVNTETPVTRVGCWPAR